VFVFTINDVEGDACTAQVDRASQFATRTIQIVVTTYWLDPQVDPAVGSTLFCWQPRTGPALAVSPTPTPTLPPE
jgi:hypothetical protein